MISRELETHLRERGQRVTPNVRDIVTALADWQRSSSQLLTVDEIAANSGVAASTSYRIVDTLVSAGAVTKVAHPTTGRLFYELTHPSAPVSVYVARDEHSLHNECPTASESAWFRRHANGGSSFVVVVS